MPPEFEKEYRLIANSGLLLGEEKFSDQLMEETAVLEEKINSPTAVTMAGNPVPRDDADKPPEITPIALTINLRIPCDLCLELLEISIG